MTKTPFLRLAFAAAIASTLTLGAGCGGGGGGGDGTTAPTVVSTLPANGTTDVNRDSTITVTFSTAMSAASLAEFGSVTVTRGGATVAHSVSTSGAVLTITPSARLQASAAHTVTIAANTKDDAGHGMAAAYTFSFTTGTLPALTAPTNLVANAGDGYVNLSWNPVIGATNYRVYSSDTSPIDTGTVIPSSAAGTGASINGLTNGVTYYFAVLAEEGAASGPLSAEASATPIDVAVPSAPTLNGVVAGDGVNDLSWSEPLKTQSFRVEFSTDPAFGTHGSVNLPKTSLAYSHADQPNWTEVYYRVFAVNSAGDSAPSNVISGLPSPLLASLSSVTDAALQACLVAARAGKTYAREVEILDCSSQGVTTLAGIEQYRALRGVALRANAITDLSPLQTQLKLASLDLANNPGITDVAPLASVTTLQSLALSSNPAIATLAPLATLTALQGFYMESAGMTDALLATLPALPALESITLGGNPALVTLTPLAGRSSLRFVNLVNSAVTGGATSLGALAGLAGLTGLTVQSSALTALPDMSAMVGLTSLTLNNNAALDDIGGLQGLTGLRILQLMGASPSGGAYANQNALGSLTGLLYLNLANSGMTSLLGLGSQASLTDLDLWGNAFTNVSSLAALTSVTNLNLQDNAVATGVASLAALTLATNIDLRGNAATMPCADLTTLIGAFPAGVVKPTAATAGVTCQ